MIIYRLEDRIEVKVDELTFKLAPMLSHIKEEAKALLVAKKDIEGSKLCIKHSVKDIKGVELSDGSKYKLEFEGDALTDKCIEELFNIEIETRDKLRLACSLLVNGIPAEFINPSNKKPIKGVKIVNPMKGKSKRKTSSL